MKKQAPALLLALLLAVMLSAAAVAASTQMEVHPPEEPVEAEENFTVTVDLTGNPGFSAVQFTLTFDEDEMECLSASVGALLNGALAATNPSASEGAILAAASLNEIRGDGTLASFLFRAKTDLTNFRFGMADPILNSAGSGGIDFTLTGAELVETAAPDENSSSRTPRPSAQPSLPSERPNPPPSGGESSPPAAPDGLEQPLEQPETGTSASLQAGDGDSVPPQEGRETEDSTAPALPSFSDTAGHWAETFIAQAAQRGIFNGYPDGSFSPDSQLTRAQFMTVLWNLEGRPEASEETPFTDIADLIPDFRQAISWAYAAGLTDGTTPVTFSPGEPLTRQAAMKILFGYSGGISGTEVILGRIYDDAFTDSSQIADWGKPAMYWGVYNGIIKGTDSNALEPGGIVTRAQMAVILIRYQDNFVNA